jgi:hypothetical protein
MAKNLRYLGDLSVEDREEHMRNLREEVINFRAPKEQVWMRIGRKFRGIDEHGAPTRAKFRSTYLWSAIQSWMSVLEPIFFASNPVFDLQNARQEDYDRNRVMELVLTQQIQYQTQFREAWTRILMEALAYGSSYPWTYWRRETKNVGPYISPVLDANGMPMFNDDGTPEIQRVSKPVQIYNAPFLEYVSLWDTYMHPDGIRGFSRRKVTGYELLRNSGPGGLYPKNRVERILRTAQAAMDRDKADRSTTRSGDLFMFGDREEWRGLQLAREAGAEGDPEAENYMLTYLKDALAWEYPIFHYDDGTFVGSYAVNKDGQMMELRFAEGMNYNGTSNRMAITPETSPGEVYGIATVEHCEGLLEAHTRFMQLALDGASLTVHPQWVVSQQYDQLIGEVRTGPGAINVVPSQGEVDPKMHLQRQDMPQGWVNAMQFRDYLQQELDQTFAQDDIARGNFPGGRKTASEISGVLQFSQNRLELVADRIGDQFARPLGQKWLAMNSLMLDKENVRDIVGVRLDEQMDGEEFKMPTIEDIVKRMPVTFKGSILATNSNAKMAKMGQLAGIYFQAMPFMSTAPVQSFMRKYFEAAGLESVTRDFPPVDPNGLTRLQQLMTEGGKNPLATGTQPGTEDGGGVPQTGGADQAAMNQPV